MSDNPADLNKKKTRSPKAIKPKADPDANVRAITVGGRKTSTAMFDRALDHADQIWALRMIGHSRSEIARKLGISEGTVRHSIRTRLRALAEHMAEDTGPQLLQLELERLDGLFTVAMSRATGAAVLDPHTGEHKVGEDGVPLYHDPDPRWVKHALDLLAKRVDLLGLTPAVKVEHGGELSAKVVALNLDGFSPAMVATLETLLSKAGLQAVPGMPLLPRAPIATVNADAIDVDED